MCQLDEASSPIGGLAYPYGMIARTTAPRMNNFMDSPFVQNTV